MDGLLSKMRGFTVKAREAVLNTQVEAIRLRQSVIDTEHLLLGLLRVTTPAIVPRLLERLDVAPDQVREAVLARAPRGEGPIDCDAARQIRLTPGAERVLEYAREEAEALDCPHVSTPYLLLGLLRDNEGLAAQALHQAGIEIESVRSIMRENPRE